MPALFVFLLKVNLALLLFCLGYYLVLRHLTFYTLNRVYLVTAIVFSTLYSKINLSAFFQQHQSVIAQPIQLVVLNWQKPVETMVKPINNWYWAEVVFWLGVALLAIRFMVQLFSLYRLHKKSQLVQLNQYTIRTIKGDINPFSFWRSIYINPANHEHIDLEAILEHEQIHVNEWHTLDIILGELSTIFYWFNPGVWLIKKAIRENIEFITDRKILQKGADSKSYQYSLLHVNFVTTSNAIVNHFNISTIKKRIMMMNAKQSSKINLTRYALLLPVVVALLLVFTVSKAELSKQITNGTNSVAKTLKLAVTKINAGTYFGITMPGFTHAPALRAKSAAFKAPHDTLALAANLVLNDTINKKKGNTVKPWSPTDSTIYIIDGNVVNNFKLSSLSPDEIALINISKPKEGAIKGIAVISITTKKAAAGNGDQVIRVYGDYQPKNRAKVQGFINVKDTVKSRYITHMVNGKIVTDTVLAKNLPAPAQYTIVSGMPLKTTPRTVKGFRINGKTDSLYGTTTLLSTVGAVKHLRLNGKTDSLYVGNGAVLTYSSSNSPVTVSGYSLSSSLKSGSSSTNISHLSGKLIYIDGKEASEKDLKKLSAADIESMSVKKGDNITAKYGEKAKDGVVFIETRKGKK